MDTAVVAMTTVREETERPRRGKIAPPETVHTAGRRKASARATGKRGDERIPLNSELKKSPENVANASAGGLKCRLSSKLLDFDVEVERRYKEMEAEGESASRALDQVRGIWKMQLPPVLRRMSLCELTDVYHGDISAALKKSRDDKVMPQMTPLAPRSVKKTAVRSVARNSASLAALAAASKPTMKPAFTSMNIDTSEPERMAPASLDVLSSSMISQFMAHSSTTDTEKAAVLAALKKQIAIIEKTIPTPKKR